MLRDLRSFLPVHPVGHMAAVLRRCLVCQPHPLHMLQPNLTGLADQTDSSTKVGKSIAVLSRQPLLAPFMQGRACYLSFPCNRCHTYCVRFYGSFLRPVDIAL